MKVAYVAGPYRSNSLWKINQNVEETRRVVKKYFDMGYAVIAPNLINAFMDECSGEDLMKNDGINNKKFLNADFNILERVDVIIMMKNYKESFGACAELNFALEHKKEVIFDS